MAGNVMTSSIRSGAAVLAGVLLSASAATAAPGLRVWTGDGEVISGGHSLAKASAVGLLQLPNGRFAVTTMTRPVVYAFSGWGAVKGAGPEHELHVDTFAAQATPNSPGRKADDYCTVLFKPKSQSIQRINCNAVGTFLVFHGDDRGPQLDRRFPAEAARAQHR